MHVSKNSFPLRLACGMLLNTYNAALVYFLLGLLTVWDAQYCMRDAALFCKQHYTT